MSMFFFGIGSRLPNFPGLFDSSKMISHWLSERQVVEKFIFLRFSRKRNDGGREGENKRKIPANSFISREPREYYYLCPLPPRNHWGCSLPDHFTIVSFWRSFLSSASWRFVGWLARAANILSQLWTWDSDPRLLFEEGWIMMPFCTALEAKLSEWIGQENHRKKGRAQAREREKRIG